MRAELVKVILYFYPQLKMLAEASEVAAYNRAVLSFQDLRPIEAVAAGVLEESVVAGALRRLHADTERVLEGLSLSDQTMIARRFFKRECSAGGRRECRRRRTALRRISGGLLLAGWTEQRFLELFGRYVPFMRVFKVIRERRERCILKDLHPVCVPAVRSQPQRPPRHRCSISQ